MTQQLSNILANIMQSASKASVQDATRSASPNEVQNRTTSTAPSAVLNPAQSKALTQAAALDNAAKVVIAKLPENILAINSPQLNANIRLPNGLSFHSSQQIQLLSLGSVQTSSAQANSAQTRSIQAALTSTGIVSQEINIPFDKQGQLFKAIAEALKNVDGTAVSLKAQVFAVTNKEISLNVNGEKPLKFPTTQLDAKLLSSFQSLVGKNVTLAMSRTQSGNISLSVSSNQPGLSGQNGKGISLGNVDIKMQSQFIESALKQGAVAISQNDRTPSALKAFMPTPLDAGNNTLKTVSLLSLSAKNSSNATLTVHTARNNVVTTFTMPESALSTPPLAKEQIRNIEIKKLPVSQLIGSESFKANNSGSTAASQDASFQYTSPSKIQLDNLKASPEVLKGSEVHKAIQALSRVLLNQTGNTTTALASLISIVEGNPNSLSKTQVEASIADKQSPSAAISRLIQHIKGLDVGTAPAALSKLHQAEQKQNLLQTSTNYPSSEAEKPISVNKEVDGGKASLGSIAQLLKSEARNASVNLINNLLQQLSNTNSKQQTTGAERLNGLKEEANTQVGTGTKAIDDSGKSKAPNEVSTPESTLPQRIQNLLSSPALLATPSALASPVAVSSFVQGLVALVQLALAGRALQRQPSLKAQLDAPDSIVSKTLASVGGNSQPSKVSQDLHQLDSRQQILSQLKTLLANHQQSKLTQADARIQGQDSFYYVLPSLTQHNTPPELLIQREPKKQHEQQESKGQQSLWNVTMKLDIGTVGQVLAKSKIDKETITLDLYASNEVILARVADTLPYLTKRLEELGLQVEKSSFQRGHIPDTLNSRPHQIFETRV
ncbi:flagellar hook-length control protein FliK [Alteromonas hispanica]|uniref:Flagellar hook-length control protein FliK n=1 Tax=Alteromonas hispanica TaxID=315421 RepID=A0A6L9MRL1_9ALTE|nr:flagellar hook-length control protein FliK [Alteromonas hispanica]NDW20553.1 flagellar hook-length control protein FliK [Alteromonas hispanica]